MARRFRNDPDFDLQTIDVLRQLFARYGLPQVVTDNGPPFTSEKFMRANGIKHTSCAPYHPSSNGAIERFVQEGHTGEREKWVATFLHSLANFLLTYQSSPYSTTGVTPTSLFLGRSLRTRFDLIRPDINKRVCEKQSQQKIDHDKRVKVRTLGSFLIIIRSHVITSPFMAICYPI